MKFTMFDWVPQRAAGAVVSGLVPGPPARGSCLRGVQAVSRRGHPDIGTYSGVKDPVVDLVITVAETWATATGWQL
jgi:hypothetical protein